MFLEFTVGRKENIRVKCNKNMITECTLVTNHINEFLKMVAVVFMEASSWYTEVALELQNVLCTSTLSYKHFRLPPRKPSAYLPFKLKKTCFCYHPLLLLF
jgi:hypothetical protein